MVIARSDEITVVRVNDGSKGDKGDTGATGKGVKSITPQYYLSTSNTTQTGGSWQNTEPEYVSGRYYWTRSQIVWTDNSTTYTSAVLAEGVNNANSNAENANNNASTAVTEADKANGTANEATLKAEQATQDAESAKNTAEDAKEIANAAQEAALKAQADSDAANSLASGALSGLQQISQVFYADATGAHVKAAGTSNETVVQSDGMHVMVDGDEVARFTKDDSHVDNLAIARFLMFGAHRAETYTDEGEEGTGFFWIGDVE